MSVPPPLERLVRQAAADQGFDLDPAQEAVLGRLGELAAGLRTGPVRGLYVHGPAGRGKTWLLDHALPALPGPRLRVHAHAFFADLHAAVGRRQGRPAALDRALDDLLDGLRVLCFDELHLHDPDDTWLLQKVLRRLVAGGGTLLATSNYAPAGLLPDAHLHHYAEPFTALLLEHTDVVALDGGTDHRRGARAAAEHPGFAAGAVLVPGTPQQLAELDLSEPTGDVTAVHVSGRRLDGVHLVGDVAWTSFAALCEGPTAPRDYVELAARVRTVVVRNVPLLARATSFGRQRFVNLVDVLHDLDVRLVLTAARPLEELLSGPGLPVDLPRTRSRLLLLAAGQPAQIAASQA